MVCLLLSLLVEVDETDLRPVARLIVCAVDYHSVAAYRTTSAPAGVGDGAFERAAWAKLLSEISSSAFAQTTEDYKGILCAGAVVSTARQPHVSDAL
jgi:tetrahydromethanopterin S-methyltransferase subunit D